MAQIFPRGKAKENTAHPLEHRSPPPMRPVVHDSITGSFSTGEAKFCQLNTHAGITLEVSVGDCLPWMACLGGCFDCVD